MKKILIILIIIVTLTGCNDKRKVRIDNNKETTYFSITENYKKGISGFYIINNLSNRIDTKVVETGLMTISTNYYDISNTYYQNGLYLDRKKLKSIVNELNKQAIKLNNKDYKLPIVSYIYETNYVDQQDNLKGISLAIAINSHHTLESEQIELTNQEIKQFIIENGDIIIKSIRNIKQLNNTKIVMGVFKLAPNDSLLPGNYIARGVAKNDNINSLTDMKVTSIIMNSVEAQKIDELNYKNYSNLENELHKKYSNILIHGIANYNDQVMEELNININVGAVSINMIMSIGQDIIHNINENFNNQNIKAVIKNDNQDAALVVFNEYNKNGSIYLLP